MSKTNDHAKENQVWESVAEWPEGTCPSTRDITTDEHSTVELACGVCEMLKKKGYGGEGKIFPNRAYARRKRPTPESTELSRVQTAHT